MENEMKSLTMSNGEIVKIIPFLTWGEKQKIESVLASGVKIDNSGLKSYDMSVLSERQYKLLELCIKEIAGADGQIKQFSREWMDALSADDGDMVFDAVDALTKKKA